MNFTEQFLAGMQAAKDAKINCLSHVIVLVHLSRKDDGDYPTRLAAVAKVSTAAMTGILDALEKLGLVERGRCADDRRGFRAHITAKGLETIALMLP